MTGMRGTRAVPEVVTETADKQMLQIATQHFVGISQATLDADDSPLHATFAEQRVSCFVTDFLNLLEPTSWI